MARLFIAAVIALNAGLVGAVSGAIAVPLDRLAAVAAAQGNVDLYRLDVGIRDPRGTLLAQPVVVSRMNVTSTVHARHDQGAFALTASFQEPKNPGHSYNPPARCQIVKLLLEEAMAELEAPRQIRSMLKVCGEPVILPISDDRIMTVELRPAPRRPAHLW